MFEIRFWLILSDNYWLTAKKKDMNSFKAILATSTYHHVHKMDKSNKIKVLKNKIK